MSADRKFVIKLKQNGTNKLIDLHIFQEAPKPVDPRFTGDVIYTITEPIPYEIKIIEDNKKKAFEKTVVTEGKNGSRVIKVTQKMEKGQPVGNPIGEEIDHTDKVDQVISIGTNIDVSESKTIEVYPKIEFVYDDTKNPGIVELGEQIPEKIYFNAHTTYSNGKIKQHIETHSPYPAK